MTGPVVHNLGDIVHGGCDTRAARARRGVPRVLRQAGRFPVASRGRLLRDDVDREGRDDVGMEPDRELDGTELLQRLVEREPAPIELDAELLLQRGDDVARCDRAEQLAALTRAGRNRQRAAGEPIGE